ncbi:hypothetical protein J5X98_20320 [Leptothermofonsia sichuanensis E412]|uniref:hypothetical protein n=1 Tax=Leptothermofonsia sichuanensis TaxID=2917832 RepID=UPI001CA71187|nr:hypothetical protein [Leptothermofonsia sichuanensis]QZZ19655.1 hypothetical protein J5X98_20320 [Leptothermofonsia sichuanensis E412]
MLSPNSAATTVPVLAHKSVKTCHILLPGVAKPVGAIAYNNQFYSYVRFYPTLESAQQGAARMANRGNRVVLTFVPKGLVLWVFEPDAQPARAHQ